MTFQVNRPDMDSPGNYIGHRCLFLQPKGDRFPLRKQYIPRSILFSFLGIPFLIMKKHIFTMVLFSWAFPVSTISPCPAPIEAARKTAASSAEGPPWPVASRGTPWGPRGRPGSWEKEMRTRRWGSICAQSRVKRTGNSRPPPPPKPPWKKLAEKPAF